MEGKKYESDLTKKEKRDLEKAKLKSMNKKERMDYIFTYYKMHMLGVVLAIIVIFFAVDAYKNAQIETMLSVTVIDAVHSDEGLSLLQDTLTDFYCGKDKYKQVQLDTNVSSADDYTLNVKMDTQIAARSIDVIVCDKATYERYETAEVFLDWEEVLGEQLPTYEAFLEDGKINIADSNLIKETKLLPYEPAYMGIVANTERKEEAKQLLDLLFK